MDWIELYVVVLCSYRPMNYGGTRGYRSSLKDLLKDRKKNTYKESIYNNKEPLWCNNVDMTSWISSYFWIYVYEHIKVLGSSSVFRLMNIKSMLAQESITILYNVYTNMNKHIQKLDSWAAMHFQFLRFWRITTKKIIFFEIAKA